MEEKLLRFRERGKVSKRHPDSQDEPDASETGGRSSSLFSKTQNKKYSMSKPHFYSRFPNYTESKLDRDESNKKELED